VQLKRLPPAVQKAIADQLSGADIKGISMEKKKGLTTYEVESMMGGKHKELTFNSSGSVVATEKEEITKSSLRSLPPLSASAVNERPLLTGTPRA
jgi:hypothetical protein